MSKRKFFLLTLSAALLYSSKVASDPYVKYLLDKESNDRTPLEAGLVDEVKYALRALNQSHRRSCELQLDKIRINARCMSTILWVVFGDILDESRAGYRSRCHTWGRKG